MVTALLFDMDGLIFDTEKITKRSWQYAANQMGFELTDEFYQGFIGVQDAECETMLSEYWGDEFDLKHYRQIRDKHLHAARRSGIDFKPGFHDLFQSAKAHKLKLALVTSSHLPDVQQNFSNTDYLSQFDLIVTAEDIKHGKPRPDCYIMACEKLGLNPNECLVLEDSNNGMKAGKDAGCLAAMIPDITAPTQEIVDRADYMFQSLEQLTELLRQKM
ncbi:HAD family hydrolase [Vibrio hangzhouensis]|uniref:HAD family hydrolase n=1 Tax=Vibrio hangzhouensis TaxID=462991 RepID=UPI001C955610|nr:HAD family phosphatase [Vibrio hangzhouensis]MBY6195665.1 HAD family phosphatase [Vibrio hangzhouensis]